MEGGGDRLHTKLDESLTEDDADADQCKAAGDHDRQDDRGRYLDLRSC